MVDDLRYSCSNQPPWPIVEVGDKPPSFSLRSNNHKTRSQMMENCDDEYDLSMKVKDIETNSSDEDGEYSVEFVEEGSASAAAAATASDVDSEYGEQTLTPRTVTKGSSVAKNDFYRESVRRQNCCFGASMLSFAGLFVAAYFLMGLSFTPSNIGIFGDENALKGSAGEVGLDADNAETQEIVDAEVIKIEEAGHWGDIGDGTGNSKAAKRMKAEERMKQMIGENKISHNHVGEGKGWVENKDWWKKHADHMDTENMTKKQKREFENQDKEEKRKENRQKHFCKKNPEHPRCSGKGNQMGADADLALDKIEEKLANHYNYEETGSAKENFPAVKEEPDREDGGKNNDKDDTVEDNKEENIPVVEEVPEPDVKEDVPVEKPVQNTIVDTFTVLQKVGHDQTSFTQGLSIGDDGMIYETTGLYGQSKVRRINPDTFEVEKSIDIDRQFFGEGSTFYRDADGNARLIEITWKEQTGIIYDAETLKQLKVFKYTTTTRRGDEGWGITYNPTAQEFIVSDGSRYLYFWDRDTLEEKRKVTVTRFDGQQQRNINELEYIDGLVCCNIWHDDHIICVDPETGNSVREYDMSSLWPANERGGGENVLNGIALAKDHILLTGKRWNRMYKVVFPDWPTLFSSVEKEDVEQPVAKEEAVVEKPLPKLIVDKYTVLEKVEHDPTSFTQGMSYGDDGVIYETTGLYRKSKVRRINPDTFKVEKSIDIDRQFFGEGSTFYRDADGNGRLIEITWQEQTGFIYDSETLEQLSQFQYTTTPGEGNEGWGITYDASNKEFIVSDGSEYLYFWDRDTLKEKRKVAVTRFDGRKQNQLNELEMIDGLVCCNIWHDDHIICVDPETGNSVREYDMSSLWPVNERGNSENVLNGIALGSDHILLTGKRWDRMYKITFPDWQLF